MSTHGAPQGLMTAPSGSKVAGDCILFFPCPNCGESDWEDISTYEVGCKHCDFAFWEQPDKEASK